jgi:hypothetical protein
MGGTNTKTVETPATSAGQSKPAKSTTKFEIHGRDDIGEVHIHDRSNQMKVAIPTATFWERWRVFEADPFGDPLRFVDKNEGTIAVVWPVLEGDTLDASVEIRDLKSLKHGPGFKAFSDFAAGK